MMVYTSYFTEAEFQCKCGSCPAKPIDPVLLARLESLRGLYGKAIHISSGWRCPEYNKKVGGVSDSAHLVGKAADLFCTASPDRYALVKGAVGLFHRIGIGTTFIHVDTDESKAQGVIWLYGSH